MVVFFIITLLKKIRLYDTLFIGDNMMGVKSIIYESNNNSFNISINDEIKIQYKSILKLIDKELFFKYLDSLFRIIEDWQKEYINTKIIASDYWKLSIIYIDGEKKEYGGKSSYPNNFEAFLRLNQKLINEVQNG